MARLCLASSFSPLMLPRDFKSYELEIKIISKEDAKQIFDQFKEIEDGVYNSIRHLGTLILCNELFETDLSELEFVKNVKLKEGDVVMAVIPDWKTGRIPTSRRSYSIEELNYLANGVRIFLITLKKIIK